MAEHGQNGTFMHCQNTSDVKNVFFRIVAVTEMIVGLPVNIVALWIFCSHIKAWKPHTLFLFNLLLADFLLLISVPFRIATDLQGGSWEFGSAWCSINLFMLAVNRSASIAFMTVVALDRYFKVVHPHHRINRMTLTQSGWLAGLMWIVVIALRISMTTTKLLHKEGTVNLCRSFSSYNVTPSAIKVHYVAFVAEFFLPWFLLLFCSARIVCYLHKRQMTKQKKVRRAIQAVGMISLVFTICFMPSILTGLGGEYIKHFHPEDCASYNRITQLFMMFLDLTYLNSALNPVIYSFASSIFHDALRNFIRHLCCMKRNARAVDNRANY